MRKFALVLSALLASCTHGGNTTPPADFGAQYLGARYAADPLGEGAGYDDDPLIREDVFDCQTYVETVLACGNVYWLTKIRYADGVVMFENRNHFFSADWAPNNSALVENVSARFGRTKTRRGTVDKRAWFKKIHNMTVDVAPIDASIDYVPYSEIGDVDTDVPMVVAFVVDDSARARKLDTDILVSHVGFLMPGGVLRHASSASGRVIDTDFKEYIALRGADPVNLGVAFFKIKEFCQ